ncbi:MULTISPECIES: AMP-binding protein [unclassified Sphingopyxis]|uniref:AMP-binding protein n=1 Tax=unclassified Sphingopyxis TaxID=2614943 RepID=UPI0028601373|nr:MULTISPECIES: AMP-binding protein [unclassified Sphingopyxis]MDR6832882.1 long-chain acyl-CoA synthetase [Sphingopyxis sp. BE122]MDR7228625.1 long-chain acyl-CoA synthetase [Sphingopyxis sp. BE259]
MDSRFSWSTDYHHPTPWDQEFASLSLPDMLAASVARRGDAAMLDFMGRRFSYAQVARGAARVARGLQQLGIGKDSRVGLFLPNVPHYVAAYYGALAAGATVVNFSPLYTARELEEQVEDSGTDTLFTVSAAALLPTALKVLDGSSLQRLVVGSVAGGLPAPKSMLYRMFKRAEIAPIPSDPRVIRFSALIANDGRPDPVAIDAETDIALIQYTGGTTGTPKGAKLTHQNLTANARQVNSIDPDHGAADRILGVLPFFHVFANTCVLNRTVLNGGSITMLPRFDAKQALAAITRTKTTALPGVPTMYQALLDHADLATTDFSSLRICISGGAPMPAELREKFTAATGASLVEGYGLTESSGVVATNPYEGPVCPGTIGQPLPATHIRLLDKEDPTRDAPDGDPGELAVKGPQIMQGYWNRPDADLDSFTADGWLRTGDVAVVEDGGYIRIVDRLKDMIAVGGFKVYPSVIEAQLYEHPAVKEAIVLGVPDAYRGEAPKAFVTLEEGFEISGEALAAWLNPQLGKHERVKAVEIRLNLPKTMIGKLDRKALRTEEEA